VLTRSEYRREVLTFHLLNQFEIPKGAARRIEHGKEVADSTLWTSASDLKNLRYYFRTYDNSRIRMIDLQAVDWSAREVRTLSMQGEEQIEDVTSALDVVWLELATKYRRCLEAQALVSSRSHA